MKQMQLGYMGFSAMQWKQNMAMERCEALWEAKTRLGDMRISAT